jgi:hypothetical protein
MIQPYSDEYMFFDKATNRYVLTEKDVLETVGINLSARSKSEESKRAYLRLASTQIYNYIHKHNMNNELQDFIISHTETGRAIIKEAMEMQVLLFASAGNLSVLPDENMRRLSVDMNAVAVLERIIPELGTTILYTGNLRVLG